MLNHKKSRSLRRRKSNRLGVATVEFAVFLPVLVLISFGSIQLSNTILLRHQNISLLEAGALNYMLGAVLEDDLSAHIEELAEDAGMTGAVATVTQVKKDLSTDGETFRDATFLELTLSMPIKGNVALPLIIQGGSGVTTSFQIYRPAIEDEE